MPCRPCVPMSTILRRFNLVIAAQLISSQFGCTTTVNLKNGFELFI
jgi:hypothetical protein